MLLDGKWKEISGQGGIGTLAAWLALGHRFRRPHAVRQAWRRPRIETCDRAGRTRDPRRARPRGCRRRRRRVRDHGPGAPGRHGPGTRAPGCDRCRASRRDSGRHDQQGLRVEHPRCRDRGHDDSRRRPRRDRGRGHGVDVERAVRFSRGEVRLQARRRRARRPHGARRARLDVRRPAHGGASVVRVARARDHPRGPGCVGASLARAGGGRDRRRGASGRRSCPWASSTPTRRPAATRRWKSSPS